jgi:hypothetical protein
MAIRFDSSEVAAYAEVLGKAAGAALDDARAVVAKGALNIKTEARRRVSGLAHAPAYPNSITYDIGVSGSTVTAEIGPDKAKRQGALGNILEYGTRKNAPIPHIRPAVEAELPRFEKALEDLAVEALE